MKYKITRLLGITLLSFSLCIVAGFTMSNRNEEAIDENDGFEVGDILPEDHVFTTMDEDGNIVEMDVTSLEEKTQEENSNKIGTMARTLNMTRVVDPSYGVVNFKTKSNAGVNTLYTIDGSNLSGYTNGYYAADGAFLGRANGKVKFMQAGVVGWVAESDVTVLNYDNSSQVKSVNFYKIANGRIVHYATNDISTNYYAMTTDIGPKQPYMTEGGIYYSYDGHHFYESYHKMIDDYKAGVRTNSINTKAGYSAYYNYYQYLSHRSKTNITAAQIDSFVNTKSSSSSKMRSQGSNFISNQNSYGSNALLMVGVAANESAWGDSAIAKQKNNLFGHAAYDSDPSGSSNGYSSPAYSIYYHAKVFVSEGYLDPKDYGGRYFGGHLGDKASGMNVKYASDPYWGEKAAAVAWQIDKANSGQKDSGKYTLAVKSDITNANLRQNASTSSTAVYQTRQVSHFPFVVMEKTTGSAANGSTVWYKIQSDPTLNANRSAITQDVGNYDFSKYYLYIHESTFDVLVNGSGSTGGESKPDPDPTPPIESEYARGDVNGDGKITPADYVLIRNHIMGKNKLSGKGLTAADMNKDGKITPADYVQVRNKILGK